MTSITKIKLDEVKREKNIRSILTNTKIKSSSPVQSCMVNPTRKVASKLKF